MHFTLYSTLLFLLLALTARVEGASIDVTEPDGNGQERLAEGIEFSAYVIGNRWDMSDPEDIIGSKSGDLSNEAFVGGIYRSVTQENPNQAGSGLSDAKFYLTFQGFQDSMYTLESGHRYPIDTSVYRTLTLKIRHLSPAGAPLNVNNPVTVYFFRDQSPLSEGFYGFTAYKSVPSDGNWHIVSFDLADEGHPDSNWSWTDFAEVKGLRIDPTTLADVRVEVDWIRLTAPGDADHRFDVEWSGGTPPYSVSARKAGDPAALLADELTSSPAHVDFSVLPPGAYFIEVSDGENTSTSSAALTINDAPQFNFLQPDRAGDVARRYSLVEAGNPWGPMDAGDVALTNQMVDIDYSNPVGSLTATTTGSDSRIVLNTPQPIDTFKYRMLSYTLSVSGVGVEQPFAIVRVLWGDQLDASLNTSDDLIITEGLNTYVIGDMRDVPVEDGPPGLWQGFPAYFRFDPHEIANPQSIRIDDITLAPLDSAAPYFDVTWDDSDLDDNAKIDIYADVDQVAGNANEILIVGGLFEDSATDIFNWDAPLDVPDGEYHLYAIIDDGLNRVTRYATGPITVGDGVPIELDIIQPDGTDDSVLAANEFSRKVEGNPWDMADQGDVVLARSSNISPQSVQGGIYSGSTTGADPKFFLLFPGATNGHDGSNGAATPIDTSRYRYLTFKARYTGNSPQSLQVYFFRDGSFSPGTYGRTHFIGMQPGEWRFITVDLEAESDDALPLTWTEAGLVQGFRIDPATGSGASFEFDWFTLTGEAAPANQYPVQWSVSDPGESLVDLYAIDNDGYRYLLSADVDPSSQSQIVDMRLLPEGQYFIEADAVPGPASMSSGPIDLTSNPSITENELRNISTRADVGTGDYITIAGFIVSGDTQKCVVVRGRGPSVAVPETVTRLSDPSLRLFSGSTRIASNDDWQVQDTATHVDLIQSLGLAPGDEHESAIYTCLDAGAYTAWLFGAAGATGSGIIEVFDADRGIPYLANISSRARVGTEDLVTIAGFIIAGNEPKRILLRGRGPSVVVPSEVGRLADPSITLKQGQITVASNDDWEDATNVQEILATGKAPAEPQEAAILTDLQPGPYTLILRGAGRTSGVGIIEVFDMSGR